MPTGSMGVGERLALIAGGALALALAQLLQANFTASTAKKKRSYGANDTNTPEVPPLPREIPAELEDELFSRNRFFFEDGFQGIREAFVIIVGLGGVGSHAAHMLVRSGVKRLRVIDFDQVTLSSLNRHSVATWQDVGLPKAVVLRDRLRSIIPSVQIDARVSMFKGDDADALLNVDGGNLAPEQCFVLDCIDDLVTKAELIAQCSKRGLRVLSSMGAGLKSDPTRLHIANLADCQRDRLAMRLRCHLKKAHGVDANDVLCVYSSEEQVTEMLPLSKKQQENPAEFGVVDNFRVRVLPVLGTTPAIFGQAMACWVLCELGGKPFSPVLACHMSNKLRHKMLQRLRAREKRVHGSAWPPMDEALLEYVCNQIWRGRCPATGKRVLGSNCLELCRWDRSPNGPGCVPNNLVMLESKVANTFDAEGPSCLDKSVREMIQKTLDAQRSNW